MFNPNRKHAAMNQSKFLRLSAEGWIFNIDPFVVEAVHAMERRPNKEAECKVYLTSGREWIVFGTADEITAKVEDARNQTKGSK